MANVSHRPYTETRTLCGIRHPPNPPPYKGPPLKIEYCGECELKQKKLDLGLTHKVLAMS